MHTTWCTQHTNVMSNMLPSEFDFAPQPGNTCSQSRCKAALPPGYGYKTCEKCRSISKLSKQKRKREQDNEDLRQQKRITSNNANIKEIGVNEAIYVSSGSETSDESNVSNAQHRLQGRHLHPEFLSKTYLSHSQTTTPS